MDTFLSKKITLLLFLCVTLNVFSQSSFDKQFEKKEYDKVYKKLSKKIQKNPEDFMNNFDFAVFYNQTPNDKFNSDSAYYFIKKAINIFENIELKEKEKLSKNNIDKNTITKQLENICAEALNVAKEKNSIESYNYLINNFPDSRPHLSEAIKLRNKLAFETAKEENSIEAFQRFIDNYPKSKELGEAEKSRNELAYKKAEGENSILSYQSFIDKYPKAQEVLKATKKRDKLAFNEAKQTNTSEKIYEFIKTYPSSHLKELALYSADSLFYLENTVRTDPVSHIDFLKNNKTNKYKTSIEDSLYLNAKNKLDLLGLKYYVEDVKGKHQDSAWMYYYKVFTQNGFPTSYTSFKSKYLYKFPYKDLLDEEYKTSLLIAGFIDKNGFKQAKKESFKKYLEKAGDKYMAYFILQLSIQKYLEAKNWRAAINALNSYKTYFKNNRYYTELIDILKSTDKTIKPRPIRGVVNTPKGGEYAPVVTADSKSLYFCGFQRSDNYKGEDIYVSKNKNGYWQKPKLIKDLSTYGNDAPLSVSTDGNEMILFKNSDLYFSKKTSTGWSKIERFPDPVNSSSWEADAMMTSDGKALIFVSTRKGGYNQGKNNSDIYVCIKTEDGWGKAINLGPTINTSQMDRSPFLHPDMKTLYFASSGHGGLGELDLYKATRLNDSSWTEWSKPVNMGKEINSSKEDWWYQISTDGDVAYFSKRHTNNMNDIYMMDIPVHLRPNFVATISGRLLDKDSLPIEATIRWEDLGSQKIVGESKSDPEDGSYFIVLPLGRNYGYYVDKEDYFPISNNIDLRKEKKAIEVVEDINMPTFEQMRANDLAVPINNLFFRTNSSTILPASYPELKRVVEIIKRNKFKVEIAGHTDNTGTAEHNQTLSEKRAVSVKTYFVSHSVPEELISTIGFGDTKPIATNETTEGKKRNRRVEMRFIE